MLKVNANSFLILIYRELKSIIIFIKHFNNNRMLKSVMAVICMHYVTPFFYFYSIFSGQIQNFLKIYITTICNRCSIGFLSCILEILVTFTLQTYLLLHFKCLSRVEFPYLCRSNSILRTSLQLELTTLIPMK